MACFFLFIGLCPKPGLSGLDLRMNSPEAELKRRPPVEGCAFVGSQLD